jgi:HK97 family phage prohead protease
VARVSAGDLQLAEDDIGLATTVDPLDEELSYVRDLVRNLEKRRITGMSFGFYVVRDEWSTVEVEVTGADGKTTTEQAELRRILELRLLEVSAVTFPAYEDTDAGLRKMADEVRAARGPPTTPPPPLRASVPRRLLPPGTRTTPRRLMPPGARRGTTSAPTRSPVRYGLPRTERQ